MHHLTYSERCQIYALNKRGLSRSAIGRELGRHPSTISRELRRNKGECGYRFKQADQLANARRQRASGRCALKLTGDCLALVEKKLALQWSPEQISGWLKVEEGVISVSHETIYRHIWRDKARGGDLYRHLRHRAKRYNKRGSKQSGRGLIPGRVDIDQRPAIVEAKGRVGDWELDSIIGCQHQGAIVSMVDRASKLTRLKLVDNKTSKAVSKAIIQALKACKGFVHTLTSDNGKEFANHASIARRLGADFFFAKPYHSWQRGLNEHTNGLVRQYFPKSTKFTEITKADLRKVENLLNNRPRKVLNFLTPNQAFKAMTQQNHNCAFHN